MPVATNLTNKNETKKQKEKESREGQWIRTSPSPGVYFYSFS